VTRSGRASLLRRSAIDISALRDSRDLRLLVSGQVTTGVGAQVALVALPYQIFVLTRSATLVGVLGAFELGPMLLATLLSGVLADRFSRRRILLAAQTGMITFAIAIMLAALAGRPPVVLVLALGGILSGGVAANSAIRITMVPGVVDKHNLASALALSLGALQLANIAGPAVGGIIIARFGLPNAYLTDALCCTAGLMTTLPLRPQKPLSSASAAAPTLRSIVEGLAFIRGNRTLVASFAIDIVAMATAWPRALFAVLSLTVYHAGATGTGLLYASLGIGGAFAVLTAGWVDHARRLGRIAIAAVAAWGAAIAAVGLFHSIFGAMVLIVIAGAADSVSTMCRSTINQTLTPDAFRGRMNSVYTLLINGGPRLGDIRSGLVAGATSATTAVSTGGVACLIGLGAIVVAFPQLASYDRTSRAIETTEPARS
jgi:MFS family permease